MPQNNQSKVPIPIQSGTEIVESDEQKAKNFEAFDNFFVQFYDYKYRHISPPSIKLISLWVAGFTALSTVKYYYFHGEPILGTLLGLLFSVLMLALGVGSLSIFSRCLTRVFHFRATVLRVTQVAVILILYSNLMPFLTVLNSVSTAFEPLLYMAKYVMFIFLAFFVVVAYIPYKHLRLGMKAYFASAFVLFGALLLFANVRNYLFDAGDFLIYSNYGSGAAQSVESLDSVIDSLTD